MLDYRLLPVYGLEQASMQLMVWMDFGLSAAFTRSTGMEKGQSSAASTQFPDAFDVVRLGVVRACLGARAPV